jgi:hypothetical protein
MPAQAHPLEQFFYNEVTATFEGKLGLKDPEAIAYVAGVVCEFAGRDGLFAGPQHRGHSMEELIEMIQASDPVHGTAPSFDAERTMRKYIGDYALFAAGMTEERREGRQEARTRRPRLAELIRAGKESYFVVSQFNVFEYGKEAELFERLTEQFERFVLGLALMREELSKHQTPARRG